MYDYLIVGAGLFGAVFAHEAHKTGKRVLVIDKRDHIAGNIYTKAVLPCPHRWWPELPLFYFPSIPNLPTRT